MNNNSNNCDFRTEKVEIFLALKPYHCEKVGYHGNDKRYRVITDIQKWSKAYLRKLITFGISVEVTQWSNKTHVQRSVGDF